MLTGEVTLPMLVDANEADVLIETCPVIVVDDDNDELPIVVEAMPLALMDVVPTAVSPPFSFVSPAIVAAPPMLVVDSALPIVVPSVPLALMAVVPRAERPPLSVVCPDDRRGAADAGGRLRVADRRTGRTAALMDVAPMAVRPPFNVISPVTVAAPPMVVADPKLPIVVPNVPLSLMEVEPLAVRPPFSVVRPVTVAVDSSVAPPEIVAAPPIVVADPALPIVVPNVPLSLMDVEPLAVRPPSAWSGP